MCSASKIALIAAEAIQRRLRVGRYISRFGPRPRQEGDCIPQPPTYNGLLVVLRTLYRSLTTLEMELTRVARDWLVDAA